MCTEKTDNDILSDDEKLMIRAYRRFITVSKPGATFLWRTLLVRYSEEVVK